MLDRPGCRRSGRKAKAASSRAMQPPKLARPGYEGEGEKPSPRACLHFAERRHVDALLALAQADLFYGHLLPGLARPRKESKR